MLESRREVTIIIKLYNGWYTLETMPWDSTPTLCLSVCWVAEDSPGMRLCPPSLSLLSGGILEASELSHRAPKGRC